MLNKLQIVCSQNVGNVNQRTAADSTAPLKKMRHAIESLCKEVQTEVAASQERVHTMKENFVRFLHETCFIFANCSVCFIAFSIHS